jgi:branched-chain amino acid transport system permease protein
MSSITPFFQVILNGAVMGMIYALIGIGFSLSYGVLNLMNLAHGTFYVLGGYFTYIFTRILGFPILIAFPFAFIVSFFVGVLLEVTLIEKTKHHGTLTMIATSSLGTVIENVLLIIFGAYFLTVPGFYIQLSFGDITISLQRLLTGVIGVILIIALILFLNRTKYGNAIRTVSQNLELAMLVGMDVKTIYFLTIGIASFLAAAAGALVAPEYALYPTVGREIMMTTWVVVIVGGMGSLKGTFISAIFFGITECLVSFYFSPALKYISTYIILCFVILIKPSGLFGVATVERA